MTVVASPTTAPPRVAVVARTMFGVTAFYAQCQEDDCGWRCHADPHADESTARRCADSHHCPGEGPR